MWHLRHLPCHLRRHTALRHTLHSTHRHPALLSLSHSGNLLTDSRGLRSAGLGLLQLLKLLEHGREINQRGNTLLGHTFDISGRLIDGHTPLHCPVKRSEHRPHKRIKWRYGHYYLPPNKVPRPPPLPSTPPIIPKVLDGS